MANIFKLAHVAREGKGLQLRQGSVGDAFAINAQVAGTLLQEKPRQHGDVFATFTQRGQTQANDVQTVIQVFTKRTQFDSLFQVLVRCGDHAHVGFQGLMATHAVELSV